MLKYNKAEMKLQDTPKRELATSTTLTHWKHWTPDSSGGRTRTELLRKGRLPSGIKHGEGQSSRWISKWRFP